MQSETNPTRFLRAPRAREAGGGRAALEPRQEPPFAWASQHAAIGGLDGLDNGLTSPPASAVFSPAARGPEGLHTPTASRCIFCRSPGVLLPMITRRARMALMLANSLPANHPLVL